MEESLGNKTRKTAWVKRLLILVQQKTIKLANKHCGVRHLLHRKGRNNRVPDHRINYFQLNTFPVFTISEDTIHKRKKISGLCPYAVNFN